MKVRPAPRAWERLLALEKPEDLWTSRDAVRADVLEALRHVNDTGGRWRDALVATARRRGITPAYIVDHALVFRERLAVHGEPDLYAILGVASDATADAIRHRWRALAKQHHPDADGRRHADAFRRIHAAYAVLGNAIERMRYDARYRRRRPAHRQIEADGTRKAARTRTAWRRYAMSAAALVLIFVAGPFRSGTTPEVRVASTEPPAGTTPAVEPRAEAPAPQRRRRKRAHQRPVANLPSPPPVEPAPPVLVADAAEVEPVAMVQGPPEPASAAVTAPVRVPGPRRPEPIDEVAANEFLGEFRRRYEAGEALGLLELFASNGVANGRRGVEIAEAYQEFFRYFEPRYTTGRVRVRATTAGATVESELVLTAHGRSAMYGVAYWDLVREGGRIRVARLVSSLPAL